MGNKKSPAETVVEETPQVAQPLFEQRAAALHPALDLERLFADFDNRAFLMRLANELKVRDLLTAAQLTNPKAIPQIQAALISAHKLDVTTLLGLVVEGDNHEPW